MNQKDELIIDLLEILSSDWPVLFVQEISSYIPLIFCSNLSKHDPGNCV